MNRKPQPELHPELSDRRKTRLFERGCELFNRGCFFAAHEPWEEIWRSQNPEPRDLFQGLVQIAAGMHIWLDRSTAGAARRVMARGCARLEGAETWTMTDRELDLSDLLRQARAWVSWLEHRRGEPPIEPRIEPREIGSSSP